VCEKETHRERPCVCIGVRDIVCARERDCDRERRREREKKCTRASERERVRDIKIHRDRKVVHVFVDRERKRQTDSEIG